MKIKYIFSIPVFILLLSAVSLGFSSYSFSIAQKNQTTRDASFEILKNLNKLQLFIDTYTYTKKNKDDYIEGWSYVLLIEDLSEFTSCSSDANKLHKIWKENFNSLALERSNKKLTDIINKIKKSIKVEIKELR